MWAYSANAALPRWTNFARLQTGKHPERTLRKIYCRQMGMDFSELSSRAEQAGASGSEH